MKLFQLAIVRPQERDTAEPPTLVLASASDLSTFSFFQRGGVEEFMRFFATTIAERTKVGQRQGITQEDYVGYVFRTHPRLSVVAITDKEYPEMVAIELVTKVSREFEQKFSEAQIAAATSSLSFEPLNDYIVKYQDPRQANTIMRVQQELDETKAVLHKTIEGVLHRGEKLDSLVDRSNQLSNQSKMFYKTAKKTNSCCIVM
ncbi:palmitoyltransferase [Coemansia brasiliensis]|uniref:Synaptobrevin homolog YKT6 n=1 Tax=Coemansia brasiliensis TaxID=2650707 RepID=A0A9W8I6P9_9FUNG|nr:palmitoyltransferase [Coemansia brasiliensis]